MAVKSLAKPLVAHVGRGRGITPRAFVEGYQLAQRPGFFPSFLRGPDCTDGDGAGGERDARPVWRALSSWSHRDERGIETLRGMKRRDTADLVVPVELSRPGLGYNAPREEGATTTRGGWDRISLPFGLFLDAFISQSIPWSSSPSPSPSSSSAGSGSGSGSGQGDPGVVGYMAQYDLLSLSPSLSSDAPPLPHTRAGPRGDREQWRSNLWIGPGCTFTPIHRDPYHNLFVQIVGRKRIHVFPPSAHSSLYLFKEGPQQNTSVIHSERPLRTDGADDMHRLFPLVEKALGATHTAVVDVGPGDAVFIPQGWFHCVASLETSVSVNWWFR
ncbi:uncharacterized protein PFL1_04879 [Pseudozyma flocculosa PF-1]|uniref:JmjC domain-containing protein n=2 Tax=Pseudozyma flocculosa TaxID=84751 RepID=A0A5C3F627_9BASI|nr:uncharacterized protein PFL1_04879 [Pseudozyma flocculosa PF-1]EPQ27742.1 hypothetical protein PFL1_04879 [Pseudozyma flocculosa PF-1]SPO39117.1 uncharacterized protein PSFLO_04596 [Pseudozyma flocculosa]